MKIEKMSLKSIKNVLSRAEMKMIMAGSSGGGGGNPCEQAEQECPDFNCCAGLVCCPNTGFQDTLCVPAGLCNV